MSSNLDKEQSPRWQRFKDRGEFVFAFVLVIYGVLGYYAVREQVDLTWRQVGITQDQIIDSERSDRRHRADLDRQFKNAEDQAKSLGTLSKSAETSAIAAEKSQAATEQLARATADSAAASHSLAESAGQSAAATQRLAGAAIDANGVSRELVSTTQQAEYVNKNVQRAYVFAEGIKLNSIMFPDRPSAPIGWTADITWDNSGNTPTNDLVISAKCWLAGFGTVMNGPAIVKDQPNAFDVSNIKPSDLNTIPIPPEQHLIGPKSTKHSTGCVIAPWQAAINGSGLNLYYYSFGSAREECDANPLQPVTPPESIKPPG